MSAASYDLRVIAIGPGPRGGNCNISAWVGTSMRAFEAIMRWKGGCDYFSSMTRGEQRMFMLFVAEAEE